MAVVKKRAFPPLPQLNECVPMWKWRRINGDDYEIEKRFFLMKWTMSDCSACEQRGGKCGFDNSTDHFKCFCLDRTHAWHCTGRP
ncbi:hypothetical protein Ddye_030005, partial [Dipteronia dyeriana]